MPARSSLLVRTAGAAALALLFLGACGDKTPPAGAGPAPGAKGGAGGAQPVKPAAEPLVLPTFVDVAEEAGVAVMNHTGKPAQKDWIVSAMGGAGVAFDYDLDGDMDLFVIDGTMLSTEGELIYDDAMRSRLFRNDGKMRFTEVTKEAGIDVQAFGFGGAACDYDDDGDPDLYVCAWGKNRLLRNNGNGTFSDVTDAAGVAGGDWDMSTACAWGDVNGDGVHDLYVANYSDQKKFIDECRAKGLPGRHAKWRDLPVYAGPAGIDGQLDRLYLGNGDGTFRDVSSAHLKDQKALYGFQPVMTDVDNDGDLDIFVANDTQENHLWVNGWKGDPQGVFTDVSYQAGVAVSREMAMQAGMGVDAADVDHDGFIDLGLTHFSHDYNTIYLNRTARSNGVLSFTDSSHALGIAQPSFLRLSWGIGFVDYDLDGEIDHISACGHVYGEIDGFEQKTQTTYAQRCQILRSSGPTSFKLVEVTDKSGPAFQMKRVWRGMVFADFDDDGDQDIWVGALNDKAALFRNDGGNRNDFLRFRLLGNERLRDPSGARVMVKRADGLTAMGELHHGASFCCDNDPRFFFGFGKLPAGQSVTQVDVKWPDGSRQTFKDVATRRAYTVKQGEPALFPEKLAE